MSAIDPVFGDDWMAIADAVGIGAHPELSASFVAHPSHAAEFTNIALELLVREWAKDVEDIHPDVPIPYVLVTDNGPCEGDCGRIVCHCLTSCCEGCVDQGACDHGLRLCDECRTTCRDCVDNLADDYIDGDER